MTDNCETCGLCRAELYRTDDPNGDPRLECYACALKRPRWLSAQARMLSEPDERSLVARLDDEEIEDSCS